MDVADDGDRVGRCIAGEHKPARDDGSPPIPPRDARYTICCRVFGGAGHVVTAKRFRGEVVKMTGKRDFFLIHGENESTLYYGYYRTFGSADGSEGEQAQRDRKMLAAMTDANGERIFPACLFLELPSPDPGGPPEWNLANTSARMYWSLQIGAYKDSPDRKRAAVEAVKEARAQGIEAYYYHGDNVSSVCVGAWPAEAVKQQETAEASNSNPNGVVVVVPGDHPDMAIPQYTADGKPIRVLKPKVEVMDPAMLATIRRYPVHSVNGMETHRKGIDPATQREVDVPDPSFLVIIKHAENAAVGSGQSETGAVQPTVPEEPAPKPSAPTDGQRKIPGKGKLRSIGD